MKHVWRYLSWFYPEKRFQPPYERLRGRWRTEYLWVLSSRSEMSCQEKVILSEEISFLSETNILENYFFVWGKYFFARIEHLVGMKYNAIVMNKWFEIEFDNVSLDENKIIKSFYHTFSRQKKYEPKLKFVILWSKALSLSSRIT